MPAPAPASYDVLPTNIDGSPIQDVIIITGERPSTFDHVYMYVADGFDAFMANGYIPESGLESGILGLGWP